MHAVTDPAGNRIENHYDGLGRRTETFDPSSGHATTKYNGFGEVISLVDGAGVQTTIVHDTLGRINQRTSTDPSSGASSTEKFVWDIAPNGVGKLASATGMDGIKTTYAYDPLGRLSGKTWNIDGTEFTIASDWDRFDKLQTLKFPQLGSMQLALEYGYDPNSGALVSVDNQATHDRCWQLLSEDGSGVALGESFAGSIATTRALDGLNRLKSIVTTAPASGGATAPPLILQQLVYDYWPGNFLKSRSVTETNGQIANEGFDYDYLGRLLHWTVDQGGAPSEQTYGYDDIGNLTSLSVDKGIGRTVTNHYGPPNAGPYAIRESDENGNGVDSNIEYNSAGRETGNRRFAAAWTAFDLPSHIWSARQDAWFRYDADHRRTVKTTGTGIVTYIGGVYERHNDFASGKITHLFNLPGPGRLLGQIAWDDNAGSPQPLSTNFFHSDALGTPETVSDPTSQIVDKMEYEPFGQRREPSELATPKPLNSARSVGFTGHEPDDEFGLINMDGRIYDPTTARFLTPDPLISAPLFSQSLNRYSYVLNNPVNLVDPSGFQEVSGYYGDDSGGGGGGWAGTGDWGEFQFGFGGGQQSYAAPSQQPVLPAQHAPTRADATRQAPDAGPGWGSASPSGSASPFVGNSMRADTGVSGGLSTADDGGVRITRTDDAGIEYSFPAGNFTGWEEFRRTMDVVQKGMTEIPQFRAAIRAAIKNKDEIIVILQSTDTLPEANAATIGLNTGGHHLFAIRIMPSNQIGDTGLYVPWREGPTFQTMPADFETTLLHEFGHVSGMLRTLLPDGGVNLDDYRIQSDAVWMMKQGYRIYGTQLNPDQQEALDPPGLHWSPDWFREWIRIRDGDAGFPQPPP